MAEVTHRGDEDMGMVLADPALARQRLLDRCVGIGDPGAPRQPVEDQRRQRVRALDIGGDVAAEILVQRAVLPSGAGQPGRAQEGPQRHRPAVRADPAVPRHHFDLFRELAYTFYTDASRFGKEFVSTIYFWCL